MKTTLPVLEGSRLRPAPQAETAQLSVEAYWKLRALDGDIAKALIASQDAVNRAVAARDAYYRELAAELGLPPQFDAIKRFNDETSEIAVG